MTVVLAGGFSSSSIPNVWEEVKQPVFHVALFQVCGVAKHPILGVTE
jgi:hypothetical protein